jgi:hypothetical protein
MGNEDEGDECKPGCSEDEGLDPDEPGVGGLAGIDLASVAEVTREPRQTYESGDGGEADEDEGNWRVVGICVKSRARLLRPAVPSETGTNQKRDACGDEAAFTQPGLFAAIRKDEFGDLHWNQDHPHAFESEHEKQVDPVDAKIATVRGIGAGERQWRDRCLLDDELFCDGEGEAEKKKAGCASAPAADDFAAEKRTAAPDHDFRNEHEEDAEAGGAAEDFADDRSKNEQRPDGAAIACWGRGLQICVGRDGFRLHGVTPRGARRPWRMFALLSKRS